jgi:hypothetical protein
MATKFRGPLHAILAVLPECNGAARVASRPSDGKISVPHLGAVQREHVHLDRTLGRGCGPSSRGTASSSPPSVPASCAPAARAIRAPSWVARELEGAVAATGGNHAVSSQAPQHRQVMRGEGTGFERVRTTEGLTLRASPLGPDIPLPRSCGGPPHGATPALGRIPLVTPDTAGTHARGPTTPRPADGVEPWPWRHAPCKRSVRRVPMWPAYNPRVAWV